MVEGSEIISRVTKAVHGLQEVRPDPAFEIGLADHFRVQYGRERMLELYSRFALGEGEFDELMRRTIWRAMARKFGNGVRIGSGVGFKHLETFEIGNAVFIGAQAYIQGRFDGVCVIGNHVWIGPQSYFDARALIIEDYAAWGPGAKVLGSNHIGLPVDVPIMQTDLEVKAGQNRRMGRCRHQCGHSAGGRDRQGQHCGSGVCSDKRCGPIFCSGRSAR